LRARVKAAGVRLDVVEQHVIDKPRPITVDVSDGYFCCSAGGSRGASLSLAALVFVLRRRRRDAES
jgi:hypothetical protein